MATPSTSSSKLSTSRSQNNSPHVAVGGDFAGIYGTFDLEGNLIPVPEIYVPPALLEWGQAPLGLEILVSEDHSSVDNDRWRRHELIVLPETGCGIDNLEVIKKTEELDTETTTAMMHDEEQWPVARSIVLSLPRSSNEGIRVETTFSLPLVDQEAAEGGETPYRSRLAVDLVWDRETMQCSPQEPLRLFVERRTSRESSNGNRADGGGLDGRTVSELIGTPLRQLEKEFAKREEDRFGQRPQYLASTIVLPANMTFCFKQTPDAVALIVGQMDSSDNTRISVEYRWPTTDSSSMRPRTRLRKEAL